MRREVKKMVYFISILIFALILTNCGLRGIRKDQSIIQSFLLRIFLYVKIVANQ